MKLEELKALINHPWFSQHDIATALGAHDYLWVGDKRKKRIKFNQNVVPQSIDAFNDLYGTRFTKKELEALANVFYPPRS